MFREWGADEIARSTVTSLEIPELAGGCVHSLVAPHGAVRRGGMYDGDRVGRWTVK